VTERKPVDWEAVEREYRAGQLSVAEIGRQQGCSHTAINKRAAKEGWTRNLAAKVREVATARLVSDGAVSAPVSAAHARETVEAAAARVVDVVRSHRRDIAAGRSMASSLVAELEAVTRDREAIEETIELETEDDKSPRRRAQMLAAVSLAGRAGALKALSDATRTFVGLERQAFNIDAEPSGEHVQGVIIDRPPRETREEWEARRRREMGA
jgi:hypothetical protein